MLTDTFRRVKATQKALITMTDEARNGVLNELADAILHNKEALLAANKQDLALMEQSNPLYDRLLLNDKRLEEIAQSMRHVATLPSPLGIIQKHRSLENGLILNRVSVPFGVIGVIYEARPNVSFDVFALCFKTGNACILKGGHDADHSNRAIVNLIHDVLANNNIDIAVVELLPSTHEATHEMLNAVGYIDLCIPRGGKKLISFVRDTARIPVIETGAGVVHTYFDEYGDAEMGKQIICNAKTRRCTVCNSLDCLIVHKDRLDDLFTLCEPLITYHVKIYADANAYQSLAEKYPNDLLFHATEESFGTEFLDYIMSIKTVNNIDEALSHIAEYGSGHSECIITEDKNSANMFQTMVDAACVYVNASTGFTDGAQFGMGAEIGISTQKLGPRGPMALEEMTTYKWLINGNGQIRQ